MKIGIVYTSTTPELITLVERELRCQIGDRAIFLTYQDPSILAEIQKNNHVTEAAASRLISLYHQAIDVGVDIIFNCCSSVGDVADASQGLAKETGIPIIRIDEEMCREAVRLGKRIGVMATLPSTLNPTKHTILRAATELGQQVELVDILLDGAFGLSPELFQERMAAEAKGYADKVDLFLLAQGSMAYCEGYLQTACGKPVLSSPRFGAKAVKSALLEKGLL